MIIIYIVGNMQCLTQAMIIRQSLDLHLTPNMDKEVVLDLKQITYLKPYSTTLKMTKMVLSDNHELLSFGIDLLNDESTVWMIKTISEQQPYRYKEKLFDVTNAKFTPDNNYLIYTKYDDKFRPSKVYLHKLGTRQDEDVIIYEENDESYFLDIQVTKDKKYFVILASSKASNEIIVLDRLKTPSKSDLKILFSRQLKSITFCAHSETGFFILTNKDVYDFKLLYLPDELFKANKFQFQDFYKPEEGEVLQEIDIFQNYVILYFRKEADCYIRVLELNNQKVKQTYIIDIPASLVYQKQIEKQSPISYFFKKYILREKSFKFQNQQDEKVVSTIMPGLNENYLTTKFRFHLDTPLAYNQVNLVYEFDLKDKQLTKLQDSQLTGKEFNREKFTCRRIYAPSKDGTLIPITLVHKKGLILNRQHKLLLHAYGAYGIAQEVPFNVVYLQALERGWILAYAHVRGGNEKGQLWHKAAIKENKLKSVEDLIASAAHLVANGYTHPSLLCGLGSSAGGTLFGAAINMRPDLWKCVVLSVPFLDVLGSLLDEKLPLTISDYDEFGNPTNDQKIFEVLQSYSPYDNIGEHVYPAIYIQTGFNDFRAPLWNVMKYVQRFRNTAKESDKVDKVLDKGLLLEVQEGGHYGQAGIQSGIEERARQLTFLEYFTSIANKEIKIESLTEDIDQSLILDKKFEEELEKKKKV